MGEAVLSLRATFPSVAAAKAAKARMEALLDEHAEDWWQDNRHRPAAEFWPEFKALHPVSCEVLGLPEGNGTIRLDSLDVSNDLAGAVDWCDTPCRWGRDGEEKPHEPWRPEVKGRALTYQALTWYWARWHPLATWLLSLGATRVTWDSPQGKFKVNTIPSMVVA